MSDMQEVGHVSPPTVYALRDASFRGKSRFANSFLPGTCPAVYGSAPFPLLGPCGPSNLPAQPLALRVPPLRCSPPFTGIWLWGMAVLWMDCGCQVPQQQQHQRSDWAMRTPCL